jgi:hypothetical protein
MLAHQRINRESVSARGQASRLKRRSVRVVNIGEFSPLPELLDELLEPCT